MAEQARPHVPISKRAWFSSSKACVSGTIVFVAVFGTKTGALVSLRPLASILAPVGRWGEANSSGTLFRCGSVSHVPGWIVTDTPIL